MWSPSLASSRSCDWWSSWQLITSTCSEAKRARPVDAANSAHESKSGRDLRGLHLCRQMLENHPGHSSPACMNSGLSTRDSICWPERPLETGSSWAKGVRFPTAQRSWQAKQLRLSSAVQLGLTSHRNVACRGPGNLTKLTSDSSVSDVTTST